MTTGDERPSSPLSIEVEPDLRQRIEDAAAAHRLSTRDYVVATLRRAVDEHRGANRLADDGEWSRLSTGTFARDWDLDADAVYDDLA